MGISFLGWVDFYFVADVLIFPSKMLLCGRGFRVAAEVASQMMCNKLHDVDFVQ